MQATDRLHALDAVRAYALLLGVVLHSAAAFLEGFPMPLWTDEPSTAPAVLYYVIHMFRMSAFFLMAGFFARMVVERRGIGAFLKDRGKRIALPLVVGAPVVMVLMGVGLVLGALPHGLDALTALGEQQAAGQQPATPASFNVAHLWFLYYLLMFYALVLGGRQLVRLLDRGGAGAAAADRVVARVMRSVLAPVLIAAPVAAYLWQRPAWTEWLGLPAPQTLVPQADALIGYGVPFVLGWLLHRQVRLLLDLKGRWGAYIAAACALTIVCLSIVGVVPVWQGPSLAGTERLVYAFAYMAGSWFWVLGLVGAALRFLSEPRAVTRYLADASYWIYLMHMATILFFLTLLRPFDWHWSVKMAIMVGGSMAILIPSYHYLVRFTWLGAILNGRRHPRPASTRAPAAAAA